MAKLGDYEFPEIGLVESIDLGKKIAREFAGEVSRQGLARSLGMSERGGAFSARLGALRMWGVASGRSRVRVTRDGLRAVTPLSAQESEDAKGALARNVPLFVEMSTRLGEAPYAPDRFGVLLEELSGADRTTVARRLALIDRIFSEARPYLPIVEIGQAPQGEATRAALQDQQADTQSGAEPDNPWDWPGSSDSSDSAGSTVASSARRASKPAGKRQIEKESRSDLADLANTGDRIELGLPGGKLSLPESLANLDAALTVLWARRQLVAAFDAADGRATPAPPRDFSRAGDEGG